GRAHLRVAELGRGFAAAAHQRAERHVAHALTHAWAHGATHRHAAERGDVDPGLSNGRLDDLLRLRLRGGNGRGCYGKYQHRTRSPTMDRLHDGSPWPCGDF